MTLPSGTHPGTTPPRVARRGFGRAFLGGAASALATGVVTGVLRSVAGAPEPLALYVGLTAGTLALCWVVGGERPTLASLRRPMWGGGGRRTRAARPQRRRALRPALR